MSAHSSRPQLWEKARTAIARADLLSIEAARLSIAAGALQRRAEDPWRCTQISGGMDGSDAQAGDSKQPDGPLTRQRSFELRPDEVRAARRFVAQAATEAGVNEQHAVLAVSELATNALCHAETPFVVTLSVAKGRLRVDVTDNSSMLPRLQNAVGLHSPDRLRGRGLLLVEAVTTRWGFRLTPGGKSVWFEITTESD